MKKNILSIVAVLMAGALIAQTFTGKPIYQIVAKRNGTTLGQIVVELWPNIAPKHVRNFDSLVGTHFFDTIAFHRVVPGFVIQGGDPNSRHGPVSTWGQGQPGQPTVDAEFSSVKHMRGVLAAARTTNINSATSQFFICVANLTLSAPYTSYGRVVSGMTVVDTIVLQPTVAGTERPVQKIEMFVTRIGSNDSVPPSPALITPTNHTVGLDTNVNFQLKWNPVSTAFYYHLDVSTDSLFIADTIRSVTLDKTIYIMNNLKGNTRYYWRVLANNGGHWSPTAAWDFHTTGQTTNIKTITSNETFMVYPNPSHGLYTFSNVGLGNTLEVLDLTGRQVFSTTITEGRETVDLTRKARGLYLYRISNEGKTIQGGKLILE